MDVPYSPSVFSSFLFGLCGRLAPSPTRGREKTFVLHLVHTSLTFRPLEDFPYGDMIDSDTGGVVEGIATHDLHKSGNR